MTKPTSNQAKTHRTSVLEAIQFHKVATATEIARFTGIPPLRLDGHLQTLRRLGTIQFNLELRKWQTT